MTKPILTAKRARELLVYEPETGRLTWRIQRPGAPEGALVGTRTSEGYTQVEIDYRLYKAHRVIWLIMTGRWPRHQVDHRNGRRADNRWSNLRQATNAENSRNRRRSGRNTSGRVGVSAVGNKWSAFIGFENKNIRLGTFDTFGEAVSAREKAERKYYGDFAAEVSDAA